MDKLLKVVSLFFAVFLSLFALDVFGEYQGVAVLVPLIMHLLPSLFLLLFSIVAWKYNLLGTAAFGIFGIGYILMVGFDKHWSWYATIAGPALGVSLLFFLNWYSQHPYKKRAQ